MKLIDALTLTLKDLGIEFVFGISGANIEHFHDAIYRLGDGKLTAILAKSEYSAAFMADGLRELIIPWGCVVQLQAGV